MRKVSRVRTAAFNSNSALQRTIYPTSASSSTRRITQNALRQESRSSLVVEMAAARTCCNFARRVLLTQISNSSRIIFSLAVRPRKLSSLVNHVPQLVIASSKWTQPTRSYGSSFVNSVDELREMTMNVLKLFDKIDPTKVILCCFM